MQKIRWFFLIVGMLLALAMALQNNAPADVQLLWLKGSLPLSVLMLCTTAIGFLFGALVTAAMLRSRRGEKKPKKPTSKPAAEDKSAVNELTK